jgi:DNA uptake protein ComE-like DNA-binding protein
MDNDGPSIEVFFLYLRNHPLIPLSFTVAAVASGFAVSSLVFSPKPSSHSNTLEVLDIPTSPRPTKVIAVDIEGAVRKPGIIRMDFTGDPIRVSDVIEKAGGLLPEADKDAIAKSLNLAAPIADGSKLYIPKKGETGSSGVKSSPQKISINSASREELLRLKGIGETRADAIIANRPYMSFDELGSKAGLSSAQVQTIAEEASL